MPDQFTIVANNFSKQNWTETCLEFADSFTAFAWQLSGTVYAGDKAGRIHCIEAEGPCPTLASTLKISSSKITSLSLNKSSDLFACTSTDTGSVTIGVTDPVTRTFEETTVDLSCTQRPLCAVFMDDERNKQSLILVGSSTGIDIVDCHSGAIFRRLICKGGAMSLCSWQGCMVAGGDNRGGVALWDARVNEPVHRFTTDSRASRRAIFSVDGTARVLAMAGASGSVHLFDIAARKQITRKKICSSHINVLCFSPRMRLLLASDAQSLQMVNLQNISMSSFPDPAHHILTCESVTDTRWDPSLCRFVVHATDHRFRLYQLVDSEKV
ncbi:hypothetical protein KIN20_004474 [Parelaphostrongylus tenuis]|uniref:WD repeat-containing protein 55 homolog n=1 Tax=Parelaphostrongylus tenuis TaxID=148309 RepID=A0AAD5MRE5_PARTN|nr:hypothetical protein KIN20_004474 [Parelaphostrongylus tenuis]